MKRLYFFAMLVSLANATNGDLMIATDTKSMGMGGVGIAMPSGALASINNPALLSYMDKREISLNATIFLPTIETKTEFIVDKDYQESDSSLYIIPSIAYATPLDDRWSMGIGMWGVAGMGVDFSSAENGSGLFGMVTDLMIMDIATPISYRFDDFTLGVAPILQVGMLNIEYQTSTDKHHPYDSEVDYNIGVKVGAIYDWHNGLLIGAVYQSAISMSYDSSEEPFSSLKLQQPQEYGIGVSYSIEKHLFAFDYKHIDWDKADGYREFGWHSQNVYAFGYEYSGFESYKLRVGYNYAKAPIETSDAQAFNNYLNLLGFPATSTTHYTFGTSYQYSKDIEIDTALIYSPSKDTKGRVLKTALGDIDISNRHKELSFTVAFSYKF